MLLSDGLVVKFQRTARVLVTGVIPRMSRSSCICVWIIVTCRRAETEETEKSPVEEEVVEEPQPVGLTLKEYEEQRKAAMSELLKKKQPRAVEAVEAASLKKDVGDYFVVGVA